MNAINIYIAASRSIMQANAGNLESLSEVNKLMTILRQCLSCCVCTAVMTDPMGPVDSICRHNVCSKCIGGKMKLRPACSWCKDYDQFVENTQLRIIVQCFKKLCQYLVSSTLVRHLNEATSNGGTSNIMTIIQEGAAVGDDYEYHKTVAPLPVLAAVAKQTGSSSGFLNYDKRSHGRPRGHKRARSLAGAASPRTDEESRPESVSPPLSPQISPKMSPRLSPKMSPRACHRVAQEHDYINLMRDSRDLKSSFGSDSSGCEEPKKITENISPRPSIGSPRSKQINKDHTLKEPSISGDVTTPAVSSDNMEPTTSASLSNSRKRGRKPKIKVGCRCGLATPTPGKLTCCGQRCPCYSSFKGCIPDCRCRGCRNPRKVPDIVPGDFMTVARQLSQSTAEEDDDEDSEIEIDI